MWHLKNIPRHIHFYWGGQHLSYLRALSIKTFQRLNPDWRITLHVPAVVSTTKPAWDTLQQKNICVSEDYRSSLAGIRVQVHDFEDYGFNNHAHEVHKSDFLRWLLLATQGGVWSDIDILYFRSMNSLSDNKLDNAEIDTILCPLNPPSKHTVGFLMSSADNKFCSWMHNTSRDCYDPGVYQCMGSDILNNNFENLESFGGRFDNQFLFLDRYAVYALTSKEIERFYQPMDAGLHKKIARSGVVGLHWFAGHPLSQIFETAFTPNNADQHNNILTHVLKEFHET
jgi:hypothetical protein